MSRIRLESNVTGTGHIRIISPSINNDVVLTLPSTSGVLTALNHNPESFVIEGITIGSTGVVNRFVVSNESNSVYDKTVTVNNLYIDAAGKMLTGTRLTVQFTYGWLSSTSKSPTLKVNSTPSYPIIKHQSAVASCEAMTVLDLVFDGTSWVVVGF